jgi:hypothetical protein
LKSPKIVALTFNLSLKSFQISWRISAISNLGSPWKKNEKLSAEWANYSLRNKKRNWGVQEQMSLF